MPQNLDSHQVYVIEGNLAETAVSLSLSCLHPDGKAHPRIIYRGNACHTGAICRQYHRIAAFSDRHGLLVCCVKYTHCCVSTRNRSQCFYALCQCSVLVALAICISIIKTWTPFSQSTPQTLQNFFLSIAMG